MFPNVLVCSLNGYPQHWATWRDTAYLVAKNAVAWTHGENNFVLYGGISRITGTRSTLTIPSIIGVRSKFILHKREVTLTRETLMARDRYICAYCGRFCRGNTGTIDHIVPISRGGKHTWNNVVCSCIRCNNYKDNNLLSETDLELIYLPYTPCYEEGLILKGRNILQDQMEFLLQFLPKHSRAKLN